MINCATGSVVAPRSVRNKLKAGLKPRLSRRHHAAPKVLTLMVFLVGHNLDAFELSPVDLGYWLGDYCGRAARLV